MDVLKQKWSHWFNTLDVNHDGMITRDDVDHTLKGLTEKEGTVANKIIEKWWNTYILKGRSKMTKNEFIKDLQKQYTEDKHMFIKTMRACAAEIVSIAFTEKTKSISVDSFVKAFKVWGYDNEVLLRKCFERYQPGHDMVSIEEYTNDWVVFVTNEKPSKLDVVFDTYRAGLK